MNPRLEIPGGQKTSILAPFRIQAKHFSKGGREIKVTGRWEGAFPFIWSFRRSGAGKAQILQPVGAALLLSGSLL